VHSTLTLPGASALQGLRLLNPNSRGQVLIIDGDLGRSGDSVAKRSGFARMTSEVALARVGIILALEVSRLARNNADWYRLLELCGLTDTLIGDNDGNQPTEISLP